MDAYRLIDGRPAADVHLRDVVVGKDAVIASGHEAEEILAATFDEAVAAVCSEAVGVMRRAFDDTVAFLQARRQFGRPLSTFQALRHRVADMYLALETAAAAAELAYDNLDATPDRRAAAVSAAKVEVARCGRSIVQSAVHLHGAIGTTTELAVGRCFKRMAVIEGLFGGSDEHLRRYASIRAAPATA
jgi:alkylation response protein AidB-like acyl-CoA dehydrogenase